MEGRGADSGAATRRKEVRGRCRSWGRQTWEASAGAHIVMLCGGEQGWGGADRWAPPICG
jgi:hypothetical protein